MKSRPLTWFGLTRFRVLPMVVAAIAVMASIALASMVRVPTVVAAQNDVARPKITGIAHVRLYSANLDASREFYRKIVGLSSGVAGCLGIARPCFAVNSRQQVELTQITGGTPDNLLAEVAFATDNVAQMRAYLLARGVAVSAIAKDGNGVEHFELRDPEGHAIAFVQESERFFSPTGDQIGTRIFHAGFIVKDRAALDQFYRGLLGFRMYWHGGFKDADVDWEELQLPDGSDWIEYMLNIPGRTDQRERGVQNHFSLGVASAKTTFERLRVHDYKPAAGDQPEIGRDGKWAFDIYDPDRTRVEFMEFKPVQEPCCHPYEAGHPKP